MIGIHIDSNINNILEEVNRVHDLGCDIIQLFVDPMTKNKEIYMKLANRLKALKMKCVIHISYTINCSNKWSEYSWHIKQCILELEQAAKLGASYVVVHLGKQLSLSKEEALNNMYTSLLYIHHQTLNISNTKILLETSSGQGSEMCFDLDDLAYFYQKLSHNKNKDICSRFGICIDTCHIFASGNDIRTKDGIHNYLKLFDEKIGIEHVKLIHLNDSKKELGSHVDRHENIGNGFIGKKALILFANFFKDLNVSIILETPLAFQKQDVKIIN